MLVPWSLMSTPWLCVPPSPTQGTSTHGQQYEDNGGHDSLTQSQPRYETDGDRQQGAYEDRSGTATPTPDGLGPSFVSIQPRGVNGMPLGPEPDIVNTATLQRTRAASRTIEGARTAAINDDSDEEYERTIVRGTNTSRESIHLTLRLLCAHSPPTALIVPYPPTDVRFDTLQRMACHHAYPAGEPLPKWFRTAAEISAAVYFLLAIISIVERNVFDGLFFGSVTSTALAMELALRGASPPALPSDFCGGKGPNQLPASWFVVGTLWLAVTNAVAWSLPTTMHLKAYAIGFLLWAAFDLFLLIVMQEFKIFFVDAFVVFTLFIFNVMFQYEAYKQDEETYVTHFLCCVKGVVSHCCVHGLTCLRFNCAINWLFSVSHHAYHVIRPHATYRNAIHTLSCRFHMMRCTYAQVHCVLLPGGCGAPPTQRTTNHIPR